MIVASASATQDNGYQPDQYVQPQAMSPQESAASGESGTHVDEAREPHDSTSSPENQQTDQPSDQQSSGSQGIPDPQKGDSNQDNNEEAHSGQYARHQDFRHPEHMQNQPRQPSAPSNTGPSNLMTTQVYHISSSSSQVESSAPHGNLRKFEPARSSFYSFTGLDPGIGYGSGQESKLQTQRYFRQKTVRQRVDAPEIDVSNSKVSSLDYHAPSNPEYKYYSMNVKQEPSSSSTVDLSQKRFESEAAAFNAPFTRSYRTNH